MITLSKSGKERQILHGLTHMWTLKYNTHESMYKTETYIGKKHGFQKEKGG